MGRDEEDLTIQVLDLPPRATLADLAAFFSYCGTVHKIKLLRDNNDQLPYALVTFGQPYAFQTALLLDDANFGGQPLRILPACVMRIPIASDDQHSFIPAGDDIYVGKRGEGVLGERRSRADVEQTRSTIYGVGQAAGRIMYWY